MFWKSKTIDPNANALRSDEYEKCLNRITELNSNFKILETEVKVLRTDLDNLRGNFSRKLKGLKLEEEKQEEQKKKDINTDGYVYLG